MNRAIYQAIVLLAYTALASCADNKAQFTSAPGQPVNREKPITADANAKIAPSTMVSTTTPVGNPATTVPKDEAETPVILPNTPEPSPGPVPSPTPPPVPEVPQQPVPEVMPVPEIAPVVPTCQLVANSYRIHQDGNVEIAIHAVNAVSATIEQSAVALDARQSASVFFKNIQGDQDFNAQVKSKDGLTATCKTTVFVTGKWHKVAGQNCVNYCASVNADNAQDPQGSRCASGENEFNTLFNKYFRYYPWGTWGGGYGTFNTGSEGRYCYAQPSNMQKRDNDATDLVTGCYCWDRR